MPAHLRRGGDCRANRHRPCMLRPARRPCVPHAPTAGLHARTGSWAQPSSTPCANAP